MSLKVKCEEGNFLTRPQMSIQLTPDRKTILDVQ